MHSQRLPERLVIETVRRERPKASELVFYLIHKFDHKNPSYIQPRENGLEMIADYKRDLSDH